MAVRILFIVAPILVANGAIICIISLATPYWFSQSASGQSFYFGLWRFCLSQGPVTACDDVKASSWINATRAMVIISVLLTLFTIALGVASIIKKKVPFSFAAAASALAQAGAMLVGLAIFTGKIHEENDSYSGLYWSFGIGWASIVFYMMGMVGFIIQALVLKKADTYALIN